MGVKSAALIAFIGMLLLTIVVAVDFVRYLSGVANGVVPAMTLLRWLIYLFASVTVTVFFAVFSRSRT